MGFPLRLVGVMLACVLLACTAEPAPPAAAPMNDAVLEAEATPQPEDKVSLTIYYRHGSGRDVYLDGVKREVTVNDELPQTAMKLLLAGPGKDDARALRAPLPPGTRLLHFSTREGTADVRLSREAITRRKRVGDRPEHESMALAAVANTMTEFPDIQRVRLSVQGAKRRQFWGSWGLPDLLVRDDTVVKPPLREPHVPPLAGFSTRGQRVGVSDRRRPPKVAAVRVQSQTTHVRLTAEVTSAGGGELSGPVPPTHVRRNGNRLVLKVRGRPGKSLAGDIRDQLADPAVRAARVDVRSKPDRVVVTLRPHRRTKFWLHTLSKPARVVLDIRR